VLEKARGDEQGGEGSVERDRMEPGSGVRRDGHAPGERGREAGVGAFGKVAESKECPGERGAGSPGVQSPQKGKLAQTKVDQRRDGREKEACSCQGGDGQQKYGVGAECLKIRKYQKQTGQDECREDGEKPGVPKPVRTNSHHNGCAEAEEERSHKTYRSKDAEGRKEDAAEVEDIGMQGEDDL
jgi:hypothetical protein